jgi:hypothetical protein
MTTLRTYYHAFSEISCSFIQHLGPRKHTTLRSFVNRLCWTDDLFRFSIPWPWEHVLTLILGSSALFSIRIFIIIFPVACSINPCLCHCYSSVIFACIQSYCLISSKFVSDSFSKQLEEWGTFLAQLLWWIPYQCHKIYVIVVWRKSQHCNISSAKFCSQHRKVWVCTISYFSGVLIVTCMDD